MKNGNQREKKTKKPKPKQTKQTNKQTKKTPKQNKKKPQKQNKTQMKNSQHHLFSSLYSSGFWDAKFCLISEWLNGGYWWTWTFLLFFFSFACLFVLTLYFYNSWVMWCQSKWNPPTWICSHIGQGLLCVAEGSLNLKTAPPAHSLCVVAESGIAAHLPRAVATVMLTVRFYRSRVT